MNNPPTGTVTFLFTDIESSTELLHFLGDRPYGELLTVHQGLLRQAFQAHHGHEVDTQGDAFFVAFPRAWDALGAAIAAQRALAAYPWPDGGPIRVRMGIHTGEPTLVGSDYVGLDVHRGARIAAAGHGGQVLISGRTCALVQGALPERVTLRDLGDHRLKGLAHPEHIYQVVVPDLPAEFPPLKSLAVPTNNLPQQLTTFIGRARELEEIKELTTRAAVLTLVGPGGTGKTRLSLQLARELEDRFAHGVWLVELAPLSDPALVPQTVATVLGVRELPGRALMDTLIDYLKQKKLLLVLDNCEHLISPSAQLAHALVRACPGLRIIATSRESLGVSGEVVYRVPPLSRPARRRPVSLEQLTEFEAVRFFVDRALSNNPAFALTAKNAPAVVEVIDRLDGIPLAIELAAARVRSLSTEQIAARLGERFKLLTGGSRTSLPHQQTLRATMDWSYDLLTDPERILLRRLSVFAGGFSLDAVEAVCPGKALDSLDILDLLTRLADKSLVATEGLNGEMRYRLLETVRQYSRDKLVEFGEAERVRTRHLDWYSSVAEAAEQQLRGAEQVLALDQLEREHDNFRAALEWSSAQHEVTEAGLRLAGALHRFWAMRGYLSEGRVWLEGLLASGEGASRPALAKALYGAGVLAFHQGDNAKAATLCERSLSLYREIQDTLGIALSLNVLAFVARSRSDFGQAEQLLQEGLTLSQSAGHRWAAAEALVFLGHTVRRIGDFRRAQAFGADGLAMWRELGDKRGIATALGLLGTVFRQLRSYERARAYHEEGLALERELGSKLDVAISLLNLGAVSAEQGDNERATQLLEESITLCKELGHKHGLAASLGNLAIIARYQGDYARARGLLEESRALWQALGDRRAVAATLRIAGQVAQAQGEYATAALLHRESLSLNLELGDKVGIAESLAWLADLARVQQRGELAAYLLGAAEALLDSIGTTLPPAEEVEYQQTIVATRALLDAQTFEAAWTKGRTISVEEAMHTALEFCRTFSMKETRS